MVHARLHMETDAASFFNSISAQASVEAPVVMTSSINKMCLCWIDDVLCNSNTSATFSHLAILDFLVCVAVLNCRIRTSLR